MNDMFENDADEWLADIVSRMRGYCTLYKTKCFNPLCSCGQGEPEDCEHWRENE